MKWPITKHEDNRRTLIEWVADFPIRCCKILIVKENSILGSHYHLKKASIFYLLSGLGEYKIGDDDFKEFRPGDCVFVDIKEIHTFKLEKGSILLEAMTQRYDPKDEISK